MESVLMDCLGRKSAPRNLSERSIHLKCSHITCSVSSPGTRLRLSRVLAVRAELWQEPRSTWRRVARPSRSSSSSENPSSLSCCSLKD